MLRNKYHTPYCLLLAALAAAVAGCSGGLADDDDGSGGAAADVPVAFAVSVDKKPAVAGRAATIAGEATTANLKSMGVFAYYTGTANFNDSFEANFMNDQEISRTGTAPWTYSPVKYWPNTPGEKITFFAYSPHSSHFTEKDPTTDPGDEPGGTFNMRLEYNLPVLDYAPRLQAEKQTDVLLGRSVMNHTKTGGQITFQFNHVLIKSVFKVRSTEPIHIDRINISGMSTYRCFYYNEDGTYYLDEMRREQGKVFFSLPDKDVPADVTTTVSTFFLVPSGISWNNCLLDVHYTNADGTKEEKNGILFTYIVAEAGDAVDYTIVIEGKAEIKVTSVNIGSDWPLVVEDAGSEEVNAQ